MIFPKPIQFASLSEIRPSRFKQVLLAVAATAFFSGTIAVPVVFGAPAAHTDDAGTVVATVGDHKITAGELDQKAKPQIDQLRAALAKRVEELMRDRSFEIRRRTLEEMADDYLVVQAAQQAHLSVDEYVKQQSTGKNAVTDADAKKFYDKNKQQNAAPYDKIKPQLMQMLNRQAMLERLHKTQTVKIMLDAKRVAVDSSGDPTLGPKNAPVTIVEFTDFQCPFCKSSENTVKQLRAKYGDKLQVVHMDYPLAFHSHAVDAANAARCANEQGKFWEFHDSLFANQGKLSPADLKASAKTLGLKSTEFDECLDKAKFQPAVKRDQLAGEKAGVDGTPAFFINGRSIVGAQPMPQFEKIIDEELTSAAQKQASAK
ncbi:MAG: thioredoxin domain-containing protein [Candidatus Binatus sp.]|uniref:thioredoxin domain-containing protein n=1 Tax=Candidatus Binatus sp. TaxID=2811406 RepID=UPI0027290773|nr:thioredoxin domain-containing protein [Candidatus Binatus sp.]MDO8431909.1 thioredoxin domain-containing protein [Candidatus Binatus sp.]